MKLTVEAPYFQRKVAGGILLASVYVDAYDEIVASGKFEADESTEVGLQAVQDSTGLVVMETIAVYDPSAWQRTYEKLQAMLTDILLTRAMAEEQDFEHLS